MPKLIVLEGAQRGTIIALAEGEIVLGRDLECALPILDNRASRRHARICSSPDG
mgnify:CR=1 FL=1